MCACMQGGSILQVAPAPHEEHMRNGAGAAASFLGADSGPGMSVAPDSERPSAKRCAVRLLLYEIPTQLSICVQVTDVMTIFIKAHASRQFVRASSTAACYLLVNRQRTSSTDETPDLASGPAANGSRAVPTEEKKALEAMGFEVGSNPRLEEEDLR